MRMAVGRDGDELRSERLASPNAWHPGWVKPRLTAFDYGFHQLRMGLASSEAEKDAELSASGTTKLRTTENQPLGEPECNSSKT